MSEAQSLADKVAVVTGAGSGFGEGIARHLALAGARVVVADMNEAAAQRVAAHLNQLSMPGLAAMMGDRALAVRADVTKAVDVATMLDAAEQTWGGLDILVNNAGMGHVPTALELVDEDTFDRVAAVNMRAIYLAMKAVTPRFKARAKNRAGLRGAVLNIASTAGVSPRPRLAWYNASKGWVITATRACAVELAPFGIRVNALNPVAGETPMLKTFMGEDTPEVRARFLSTIPLGRFSTPDDLGQAAVFLCSDAASMITGVCMEVDGGRCL
jgi:3-oxoacyl-[acyl-carrier protein] reductase